MHSQNLLRYYSLVVALRYLVWGPAFLGRAQSVCTSVTSADTLQAVIDAYDSGDFVCIKLLGKGGAGCAFRGLYDRRPEALMTSPSESPHHHDVRHGGIISERRLTCRGWSLLNRPHFEIKADQEVLIDCTGNEFTTRSNQGNLTMGRGSKLQYVNCNLLEYEFPANNRVYGSVHAIRNSTVGMGSCLVRASATVPALPKLPPSRSCMVRENHPHSHLTAVPACSLCLR